MSSSSFLQSVDKIFDNAAELLDLPEGMANQIKSANDLPNNIESIYLFQLFSHAHQLMSRFDVEFYNGETGQTQLIYTALDYEHPPILELDPPLTITNGQSIISRATYYNDTDDYVNFGLLSTDEMMIVFGLIYIE